MHVEHGTQPRCKGCKGMIWIDRGAMCKTLAQTFVNSQVSWNSATEVTEMSMDNIVNIAKQKAAGEIPSLSTPAVRRIMQHQLGPRVSISNDLICIYIYIQTTVPCFLESDPTLWDHRKPIKEWKNDHFQDQSSSPEVTVVGRRSFPLGDGIFFTGYVKLPGGKPSCWYSPGTSQSCKPRKRARAEPLISSQPTCHFCLSWSKGKRPKRWVWGGCYMLIWKWTKMNILPKYL